MYIFNFNNSSPFSIYRVLLFSITLFSILYFANINRELLPKYKNYKIDKNESVTAIKVGNSHNMAIDFTILDKKGLDFYVPAMDLYEFEALLPHIVEKLPSLNTIFYPLDYLYLLIDNGRDSNNLNTRKTVYNIISPPPWKLIHSDLTGWIYSFIFSFDLRAIIKNHLNGSNKLYEKSLYNPFNVNIVEDRVKKHLSMIESISYKELPLVLEESTNLLNRVILFTQQRGINLIFYKSPISKIYDEISSNKIARDRDLTNLDRSSKKVFSSWLIEKKECVYYVNDIWDTDIDGIREDYFQDSHHLNSRGAKIFSLRLKDKISDIPNCLYLKEDKR